MPFHDTANATPLAPERRWEWRWLFAIGTMLLIAAVWWNLPVSAKRLLVEATRCLEAKQFQRAEQLCLSALRQEPDSVEALTTAASAAQRNGRREAALEYFKKVIEIVSRDSGTTDARISSLESQCGKLALESGRLREGEEFLLKALARTPQNDVARTTLIYVLRIEGRNWEAREWIRRQFVNGVFSPDELFLIGTTNWVWIDSRDTRFLEFCQKSLRDDPLPNLALARQSLSREDVSTALPVLQAIVDRHPMLVEAQVSLGTALLQQGSIDEFSKWIDSQSRNKATTDHPEYWFLNGRLHMEHQSTREAVSCFVEALRRQPDHRGACSQLSRLLAELGESDLAANLAERSRHLARVEDLLREVQQTPSLTQELSQRLMTLGRSWEALGWATMALAKQSNTAWAKSVADQVRANISPSLPLVSIPLIEEELATKYPLMATSAESKAVRATSSQIPLLNSNEVCPTFEDVAKPLGISFRFDNGHDPSANRSYMFEFSGGGIAVLDFDLDEWPDLYLTQAGRWPLRGSSANTTDRLYRHGGEDDPNMGGAYVDVTSKANVAESGFSQSATVGDFDNDGFPDLYVTNIGANRHFRNNGDGTFTDVTTEANTAGDAWSLGAAFADFDRDGLADLYVVNYLAGDVLTRNCLHRGRSVQCPPASFPAEQDRFYVNLQDGRFEDATARAGIERPEGKGMGLVVADMNDDRELDIFVANDTTPNFLFLNQRTIGNNVLLFEEQGVLAGIAFDDRGQPQSSMGCALGDANGDGLPDLFVTNYLREPNNLFQRTAGSTTFRDVARPARLHEPSLNVMGWGTQFLDAEGDGDLDVVIANGHLDDYSNDGVPYRMRTHLFLNDGTGRFDIAAPKQAGRHFERDVLGRAVARLDWNRDGRDDIAMTRVDEPFALLSNTTTESGRAVVLSLRGTNSARDVIGATIEVHAGSRRLVRQITSGDGFAASNERKLVIGLGKSAQAERINVQWPSGLEQSFENIPTNHEWRLIEGRPLPISVRKE